MTAAADRRSDAGPAGVGRGSLWFGLLGGALAWTAHLLFAYGIAEFGCLSPAGTTRVLGLMVVTWLLAALSAVTLAVAVAATLVARRAGRRLRRDPDPEEAPRAAYLADAGAYLSGMFCFVIVVESLPILYYLRDC